MIPMLAALLGGIGLFLIGMELLTEGIKSAAGDSLRRALVRFTGRPIKAFASGAAATLVVQSSSATTLTVIGFVSAGLLTFPQAVGAVIGSSFGTTGTGWIVSVLGLKVSIGLYALPIVGIGAFLKLLGRGRWAAIGTAIAGFGLIFVGIDALQRGMADLSTQVNLAAIPSSGFFGHALMMLIGAMLTVVMQSSSAAMATTLTALHTGSISFEQAASLVIGASIGTTATSALAAIGASVSAKRTALAHVLFNLATGAIAIVLLPLLLWGIGEAQQHLGLEPGAVSLAAFHSGFVLLGVVLFLPFTSRFAGMIERLLPETGRVLTRHFDDTLLKVPGVALEATRRALTECAVNALGLARDLIDSRAAADPIRNLQNQRSLDETQAFLAKIPSLPDDNPMSQSRIAQMHALDHLARLHGQLHPPSAVLRMLNHQRLAPLVQACRELLETGSAGLEGTGAAGWQDRVAERSRHLADLRRGGRPEVFRETAAAASQTPQAMILLDAMRWLDRVGYHAWRICHYLGEPGSGPQPSVLQEQEPAGD